MIKKYRRKRRLFTIPFSLRMNPYKCRKRCRRKCRTKHRCCRKKDCCHHERCCKPHPHPPIPPWPPIPPVPPIPPTRCEQLIDKECCGSILVQGVQPSFQIWQSGVECYANIIQVSVYSSGNSTNPLIVDIVGEEDRQFVIQPGNTVNFIGRSIHIVRVSVQNANEFSYVEGKYVVSTSLHTHNPYIAS